MKKLVFVFVIALIGGQSSAQNQVVKDDKGRDLLLGAYTEDILHHGTFANWYVPNKKNYAVDKEQLLGIKSTLNGAQFELFMGTWCGDSKRGVPQILKVLGGLDLSEDGLKMIAVDYRGDQYKKSPDGEEVGKNIRKVPTLVVYRNGKEIGRIIERPKQSWEGDLHEILRAEAL